MSELRWTLLALGGLFLAVLAWWELRRPRQAHNLLEPRATPPADARLESEREPGGADSIELPEMRARIALTELPVLRVADDAADAAPVAAAVAPQGSPPVPEETARPAHPPSATVSVLPSEPIVEWPPESTRTVVALRLVAPGERFQGRMVRQALAAEGFVLGKFAIFHRPAADGRAVVSAASLTKPGTFDRESIDRQRYGGLNLFAVLPGPLSPAAAFDELLGTARGLNDRLHGALQDEHGEPLTPLRVAAIRGVLPADSVAAGRA